MQANIDSLQPRKGLIDLSKSTNSDFGLGDDLELAQVYNDIILAEFIDLVEDSSGAAIKRNGLYIPENAAQKAWRKARVVLVGNDVTNTDVGDIILFPNDYGVYVDRFPVYGYGTIKHGVLLNESRIFGSCKQVKNESHEELLTESATG